MRRKTRLLLSFGAIFILLAATIGLKISIQKVIAQEGNIQSNLQFFAMLLETLQRNYVEDLTTEELLENAINGMLANLDPHTVYLPVDNFKRWNQNFEGYTGVGILFDIIGKYPMITGFVGGSPAAKANLQVGDVVLKINNQSTQGLAKDEVINYISGHSFSIIRLKILDRTLSKTKTVLLERAHLNLNSIEGAYMISSNIGYIALERFNSTTATELDEALESLLAQGMESLILDLRDNGGGYLSAAVEVTDRFLPSGKLMVFTKGRHTHSYQEYYSTQSTKYETLPLIILINHGTASAAEIVAGALQDWDRALIVGTTSFGKGLVQSQFRFRDGSALLVTTAHYYTPLGRLIQRDYNNMSKDEYYAGAYDNNREQWRPRPGKESFKTPNGRIVYGGGGITPDIVIKNEHAEISDELRLLYISKERFFYKFASRLIIESPEFDNLIPKKCSEISITPAQIKRFYNILVSESYEMNEATFQKNARDIAFLLKRDIAYLIAGNEGRFYANMDRDTQLLTAFAQKEKASSLLESSMLVKTGDEVDNTAK